MWDLVKKSKNSLNYSFAKCQIRAKERGLQEVSWGGGRNSIDNIIEKAEKCMIKSQVQGTEKYNEKFQEKKYETN